MSAGTLQNVPSYRLSVRQYHRMIQAGILGEDDPVELLEGQLVSKMPEEPPHDGTISVLGRQLNTRLPEDEWIVRIQSAITLSKSEPEPDLAVVTAPEERYLTRHPLVADIGLLIEVADSSLELDRLVKGPIYARAGIPEYWIVNLVDLVIEVYTNPRARRKPAYQTVISLGTDELVALRVGGVSFGEIPVSRILRAR